MEISTDTVIISVIIALFGVLITVTLGFYSRGNNKRLDDTIKRLEKMEAANTDLKREIVTAVTSAIEGLEGKMNEKFKSVDEKLKTIDENIRNLQTEVKDNAEHLQDYCARHTNRDNNVGTVG